MAGSSMLQRNITRQTLREYSLPVAVHGRGGALRPLVRAPERASKDARRRRDRVPLPEGCTLLGFGVLCCVATYWIQPCCTPCTRPVSTPQRPCAWRPAPP